MVGHFRNSFSVKYPFIYDDIFLIAEVEKSTGKQWLVMQKVEQRTGRVLLEDRIRCIHTAVTDINIDEFEERIQDDEFETDMLKIRSSENLREVNLAIEEKFFAFKSWTEGIAEAGMNAISIQENIERFGNLIHPIANRLFKFLLKAKATFLMNFLEKIERECVFEGEYHRPSVNANLLKLLDIIILKEREAWNIWRDQVEERYDWSEVFELYLIEEFDDFLENMIKLNPSANIFLEDDKFNFILTFPQAKTLSDFEKATNDSVHIKGKFYFIYNDKELNLRTLDLSVKNLGSMDIIHGLDDLRNLEKLHLEANKIERIRNLESQTDLKELYLTNNWIKTIEGLETLENLEILYLSYNYIEEIAGLESLSNLKNLYLFNNSIKKIENLEKLSALEVLGLSSNQITSVEGLGRLTNLRELNLCWNQIEKIENLDSLIHLTYLGLGANNIKEVNGLEKLTKLTKLDLFENQITKSPNLSFLPSLKQITLEKNPCTKK